MPSFKQLRNSRPDRHYPVELDIDYQIVKGTKMVEAGRGRTVSISSTTVVFKVDHQIPAGLKIKAVLEWPVRLRNSVPLRLHIHGLTVPQEQGCSGIRISGYEFRISKS